MTDNTTESTDGVPLADLPLENTRRTLLRVLGGAAAVGGASGLAVGGGEEDEEDEEATNTGTSDRADAETDPEDDEEDDCDSTVASGDVFDLSGFALKEDELHLDLLRITPTIDGEPTELLAVEELDVTVEDNAITDTDVDSFKLHKKGEKKLMWLVDHLADGDIPDELDHLADWVKTDLKKIDTRIFKYLKKDIKRHKSPSHALEYYLKHGDSIGANSLLAFIIGILIILLGFVL